MIDYLLGALIGGLLIALAVAEPMLLLAVALVAAGYVPVMWATAWIRRARMPIGSAFKEDGNAGDD